MHMLHANHRQCCGFDITPPHLPCIALSNARDIYAARWQMHQLHAHTPVIPQLTLSCSLTYCLQQILLLVLQPPSCCGCHQSLFVSLTGCLQATTPHWCFGADNSGDIRRSGNIQALWKEAAKMCQQQQPGLSSRIMLVTADGAIDSSANPNEQEEATAALHMCEMVAAVGLLSLGGSFVIKVT